MKPRKKPTTKTPPTASRRKKVPAAAAATKAAVKKSVQPAAARPSKVPRDRPAAAAKESKVPQRSYWQRYKFYMLAFVGSLALFGVSIWLMRRNVFADWRHDVLRYINNWPDSLRPVFVAITVFGSFWVAAVGVAAVFFLRLYQLAWRFALSIFTAFGLLILLKEYFARLRPGEVIGDLHVRVVETGYAFPSAHVTIATVLALTLVSYLPNVWRWFIVAVWIGAVGVSRLYLGVHAPLDIVAGFALGVGVVCFWRIMPRVVKKFLHLK